MPQTPKTPPPPDPTNSPSPAPKASPAQVVPPTEPPELQELRKASEGLEYPSESDTPFDAFHWPAQGAGAAKGQTAKEQVAAHAKPGSKINEVPLERFFGDLEGADDAERFKHLRQILTSRLAGLGVFRASGGAAEVDVYLLGRAKSGEWVGLHTVSVET